MFHFLTRVFRRDDEVQGEQHPQSEESAQQAATWDDLEMDEDEEESSGYESDQPASRPKQQPLKKGGIVKKKTLKANLKMDKKASRTRVVRRYLDRDVLLFIMFMMFASDMVTARMTRKFSKLPQSLGARKLFTEKLVRSSSPKWMSRAKEGLRV